MKKLLAILLIIPLLFTACGDEDEDIKILLKNTSATLYQGDTYQIEATSQASIKYTVKKPYHAAVSNSGLITAGYVGKTSILLDNGSDTTSFELIIEPRYTFIETPYLIWGASMEDLLIRYQEHTFYTNEEQTLLMSKTINTEPVIQTVFFFGSNDFLSETALFIRYSHYSMTHKFLLERYPFVTTLTGENGNYIHLYSDALDEEDETMGIAFIEIDDEQFAVTYLPVVSKIEAKETSKSQLKSARIERVKQLATNINQVNKIYNK